MGPMAAAGPNGPVQGRVDWQQALEEGFHTRHARRLQSHGGRRQRQEVQMPMTVGPSGPAQRPMAAAGPNAPRQEQVDWNQVLVEGFQGRHARQLRNFDGRHQQQNVDMPMHAGPVPDQNLIIGRQERYAEEERQHAAHLHNMQLRNDAQRLLDHDREVL